MTIPRFNLQSTKLIIVASTLLVGFVCNVSTPIIAFAAPEQQGKVDKPQPVSSEKSPGFRSQQFMSDNDAYFFDPSANCAAGGGGSVQLAGNDNTEKILNFFMQKGLSLAQAAGFVGNMMQESGLKPNIEQGGRIVGPDYVPISGVGFGLVQWTFTDRQAPLMAHVKSLGVPVTDLGGQLSFVWEELHGSWSGTLEKLKATNDPVEAAIVVHDNYEISADTDAEVRNVRGGNAQAVYDKYKDAPPADGGGAESASDTSSSSSSCSGSTGGKVNSDGYAFPIGLPKDDVSPSGGSFPCESATFCGHHDNTPAFDISDKEWGTNSSVGTPVIAIHSGKIERLSNRNGLSHCWDFQIVGDDGWWYWYGHSTKVTVQNGQTVTAGQQIAEVGPTECADNTPSHLHIDRGSPKGHYGGSVGSRDPSLVPLINSLWEEL